MLSFTLCFYKFSVEYIQLMFVGSMSIIGKNVTEDFPGWLLLLIVCINPDQFGLRDIGLAKLNCRESLTSKFY